LYYALSVVWHAGWPVGWSLFLTVLLTGGLAALGGWLSGRLWRPAAGRSSVSLPVDSLVMRLIEIINGVPALLLLLAVVAILREPRLISVMLIIGLLAWTTIARFVRAELLRIRRLEYVEAARVLGIGPWRILWRHALPNALDPVLITLAFGMAGAVLLEAILSFLGIGLPPNLVTWGSMLQHVREAPSAWWLVVFPGLAIFVTIAIFNLLGEALRTGREAPADGH
jgi:peptide/nickel transport system permease protein